MADRQRRALRLVAAVVAVLLTAGCAGGGDDPVALPSSDVTTAPDPSPSVEPSPSPSPSPSSEPPPSPSPSPSPEPAPEPSPSVRPVTSASEPPDWYQQRFVEDTATGYPPPQPVPPEYVDRRLVTQDVLPPPEGDTFVGTVTAVTDEVLARSTWQEGCPVEPDELRYVQVSFWGFDGRNHTGELLVNEALADDVVQVFALLHDERFPVERMVIPTRADLDGYHNRGDDNTTAAFECRPVTGGSGWSWHAYGRAIDINPFHNPYLKEEPEGTVLLPIYAGAYLDRDRDVPGMINEGDPVVRLFDQLGWQWGGRFNTLKDWQHFVSRP